MERLSRNDALKAIRGHLNDGFMALTVHFRDMMKKRRYSMLDVTHAIKNGVIYTEPEKDVRTGEWKYKIEGQSVDGEPLTVVVSIAKGNVSNCITLY